MANISGVGRNDLHAYYEIRTKVLPMIVGCMAILGSRNLQ